MTYSNSSNTERRTSSNSSKRARMTYSNSSNRDDLFKIQQERGEEEVIGEERERSVCRRALDLCERERVCV